MGRGDHMALGTYGPYGLYLSYKKHIPNSVYLQYSPVILWSVCQVVNDMLRLSMVVGSNPFERKMSWCVI